MGFKPNVIISIHAASPESHSQLIFHTHWMYSFLELYLCTAVARLLYLWRGESCGKGADR